MTATGWGKLIGIDRSTASRLLRGERKLNTAHIAVAWDAASDPSKIPSKADD